MTIHTARKLAASLVAELRAALGEADPVSSIVIIKQIEAACEIAYTLDSLCRALTAQGGEWPVY